MCYNKDTKGVDYMSKVIKTFNRAFVKEVNEEQKLALISWNRMKTWGNFKEMYKLWFSGNPWFIYRIIKIIKYTVTRKYLWCEYLVTTKDKEVLNFEDWKKEK